MEKPIFISTSLDLYVMHDFKDDSSLDTDASGVDSSSQLNRPCWAFLSKLPSPYKACLRFPSNSARLGRTPIRANL